MKKPIPNIRNLSVSELMYILINDKNNELEYCANDFITHIRLNTGNFSFNELSHLRFTLHRCLFREKVFLLNGSLCDVSYIWEVLKGDEWRLATKKIPYKEVEMLFENHFFIEESVLPYGYIEAVLKLSNVRMIKEWDRFELKILDAFRFYCLHFSIIVKKTGNIGLLWDYSEDEELNKSEQEKKDFGFFYSSLISPHEMNIRLEKKISSRDNKLTAKDIFFFEDKRKINELVEIVRDFIFLQNGTLRRGSLKELGRIYFYLQGCKVIDKNITNNKGLPLFFSIFNIRIKDKDVSNKIELPDKEYIKSGVALYPITATEYTTKIINEKLKNKINEVLRK